MIAADHALKSAVEAGDRTSEKADKELREAAELLRALKEHLPSKDPTPGPRTIARETNFDSETMLYVLDNGLYNSKVKFLSVS